MRFPFTRVSRFLDVAGVGRAIRDAEARSAGEIRVSVAPPFWGSVDRAAERAFARMGMAHTKARSGVLLFIVPSRRSFVVLGDVGIHERVGPEFWNGLVHLLKPYFLRGEFTEGVVAGIGAIGEQLERHFPRTESDVNELPDSVDSGAG